MISCPHPGAHHSFLPQAGGQALRRGGRGAEEQVGLGQGLRSGGWCPTLQPRPWPDFLGIKGLPEPALTPVHPSEGRAALNQAPSLVLLGPCTPLAPHSLCCSSALEGRAVSSQAWSKLCPADGGGHPAPLGARLPAAASFGRVTDGTVCALPRAAR